jgi:hypothetical protein
LKTTKTFEDKNHRLSKILDDEKRLNQRLNCSSEVHVMVNDDFALGLAARIGQA